MHGDQWPSGTHYVENANLPAAFFANVEAGGDSGLLFEKTETGWKSHSWSTVADHVSRMAAFLVARGIGPGDRVMVSAENRPEWAIADLAAMSIGAIVVPPTPLTQKMIITSYLIIQAPASPSHQVAYLPSCCPCRQQEFHRSRQLWSWMTTSRHLTGCALPSLGGKTLSPATNHSPTLMTA